MRPKRKARERDAALKRAEEYRTRLGKASEAGIQTLADLAAALEEAAQLREDRDAAERANEVNGQEVLRLRVEVERRGKVAQALATLAIEANALSIPEAVPEVFKERVWMVKAHVVEVAALLREARHDG